MDDFPGNSQRQKEAPTRPAKAAEKEKLESVVSAGKATRRKKPIGKRFRETFAGGDARSVWSYIVMDVLVPSAKDMVAEATTQGVERMIFGEVRGPRYRGGARGSVSGYSNPQTNYQTPPWKRNAGPEPRREISQRARSNHDFDEIVLESRAEAEIVLDRLYDLLSRFEQATVSDLYDLTGITGSYTDKNWGWTKLTGAGVQMVRGGYLLNLPQPEPIS